MREFAVEGNDTSGYVGVDQEYRTYANESERPIPAEGGSQQANEERFDAGSNLLVSHLSENVDAPADDENEEELGEPVSDSESQEQASEEFKKKKEEQAAAPAAPPSAPPAS